MANPSLVLGLPVPLLATHLALTLGIAAALLGLATRLVAILPLALRSRPLRVDPPPWSSEPAVDPPRSSGVEEPSAPPRSPDAVGDAEEPTDGVPSSPSVVSWVATGAAGAMPGCPRSAPR